MKLLPERSISRKQTKRAQKAENIRRKQPAGREQTADQYVSASRLEQKVVNISRKQTGKDRERRA